MEVLATETLRSSFGRGANAQAYQLVQWQRHQAQIRDRRQKQESHNDQASELLDAVLTVATTEEIESFRVELDSFDVATVDALQENAAQIEQVEEQLEEMLNQAHVLSDGRRVFKTEDGLRVFDEHGEQLGSSVIDPAYISDDNVNWESFSQKRNTLESLNAERSELIEYQEKLDLARDELDVGDITANDLDAMKEDLKASMPDAVLSRIPGMEMSTDAELELKAETLDISPDMVPGVAMPGLGS